MGVDADELIIRPFREVIERGNEALANSGEEGNDHHDAGSEDANNVHGQLAKAGHALVREGERALKRLQPIWDGQVEKYGDAFKDAMLQQDDIEKKRLELEDLLYDFEDYIEADTFEADKFAAVQAATRSFALDVINHTKRLKLETPHARTFPPLPPLPPLPPIPREDHRSVTSMPRSPYMKTIHPRAMAPSAVSSAAETMAGDEDILPEAETPHTHSRNGPGPGPGSMVGLHNRPGSRLSSNGSIHRHESSSDIRRRNTRSSIATSSSRGFDLDRGRPLEFLDDFPVPVNSAQVLERRPSSPTMVSNADNGHDSASFSPRALLSNDAVRITAGKPTIVDVSSPSSHPSSSPALDSVSPLLASASIPRTSAWVRSHQTPAPSRTRSSVRTNASRDTMGTEYSNGDVPAMLSRFNSLTIDRDSSAAPSAAPSVFDAPPRSPSALTDSRTSFFSSAANSYTCGSPVFTTPDMPPLPTSTSYRDPRSVPPKPSTSSFPSPRSTMSYSPSVTSHPTPAHSHSHRSPLHIDSSRSISPPPASPSLQGLSYSTTVLPPPALASPSIQDFINFEPSPPLPPIRLRLSPRLDRWREEQEREREEEQEMNGQKALSPPLLPQSPVDSEPAPLSLPPASLPSDPSERHFDNGLMLAEEAKGNGTAGSKSVAASVTGTTASLDMSMTREYVREADCSIGPTSSFHSMGGFCKGAESFRVGGHWQGIRQTGGYVANKKATIGRCVGCGYAHNYEEVRLDIDKKPEATFTKAGGARFRLRLLYKSHISNAIASQRQAESYYGCIFCLQTGATVREGDATAFPSPNHLLLHLARHPQPLPIVPGVTVVYGELDPDSELANDFDLHLTQSPLPTPVPQTVGQAAVATAVRDHMQRYGAKKLARPDGYTGDMLHFLTGARVVGLMFPERWEGKWCMGWHDGFVGAFSAKAVQIEPPRQSEIPMESSSGMSVKARWKWKQSEAKTKEKGKKKEIEEVDENGNKNETAEWLDFDKGEIIHDVKCLYADHWCWAGTNSKGHYGVFPQSHILPTTLQQENQALPRPRAGWSSKGKGLFGKGGGSRRPLSSSGASSMSSSTRAT